MTTSFLTVESKGISVFGFQILKPVREKYISSGGWVWRNIKTGFRPSWEKEGLLRDLYMAHETLEKVKKIS